MSKIVLFFMVLIICISCKKNENNIVKESILNENVVSRNYSNTMFFSYEDIEEVVIYSFLDKEFINQIDDDLRKDVNFNSDVQLSNDFVKEKIVLSEVEIKKLFSLITKDSCRSNQLIADCYNPRHQIFFKGGNNEVLGDIEICFSCGNIESSKSIGEANKYCLEDMRLFFWEAGIKYFINDDHKGLKTEQEQIEIQKIYKTLPKIKHIN